MKRIRNGWTVFAVACILWALVAAGCATNPVTGQKEFVAVSEDEEIAIGRREHPRILEQYGEYDDPQLQRYVQNVGEALAAKSHRDDLVYRFTVLDSPDVNAFALPGGYIYITRGLMAYLNSEAELAAVLGHELGHVTARHSVRQMSAAMATDLGFTLGSIFVPELRNQAAQDLMNVLGTAFLRGYGRDHELEADRLGAEYLARAGYQSEAMIKVIGVLKNQEEFEIQLAKEENREPRIYHGVFSTHPANDERLQEVVAAAEKYEGGHQPANGRNYLHALDGMVYGPSPDEGVIRDAKFYHAKLGFGISLPEGWKVDNLPDRLLATAPGGAAIFQMTVQDLNKRVAPADYLREQLEADRLREEVPLAGEGTPGHAAVARLRTPFGTRDSRVAVVFHGNRAYQFVGVPKAGDALGRFDNDFLTAIRSFHALGPQERTLARPLRIQVLEADSGTTYESLASRSSLSAHPVEQLRLLNQDYPSGQLRPGELVKTVE